MLGIGAADNNIVLVTERVGSEADSQGRSPTDYTDVRLPQTSCSAATTKHVIRSLHDLLTLTGL